MGAGGLGPSFSPPSEVPPPLTGTPRAWRPPGVGLSPHPNLGRASISTWCPRKASSRPVVIHPGVCAMAIQGLGAARQVFWQDPSPRGQGRRSRNLQPSPAPGPDPDQPGGQPRSGRCPLSPRGAGSPASPAQPGARAARLCARSSRPAGLFWVLGGSFPSGPTSLPVKESEVGRDLLSALHLPLPPVTPGCTRPPPPPAAPPHLRALLRLSQVPAALSWAARSRARGEEGWGD